MAENGKRDEQPSVSIKEEKDTSMTIPVEYYRHILTAATTKGDA
jgi:hypothetical protein